MGSSKKIKDIFPWAFERYVKQLYLMNIHFRAILEPGPILGWNKKWVGFIFKISFTLGFQHTMTPLFLINAHVWLF